MHEGRAWQEGGCGVGGGVTSDVARVFDLDVGHGVDPPAEGVEHVLVTPHHTLREAGRAARVEDVDVIAVVDDQREPQPVEGIGYLGDAGAELAGVDQTNQVGVGEDVA